MTRTVQILELRQKRCTLRFGVGACEATGSPKCFQTFETCGFRSAFNRDGELRWYFTRPGDPAPRTAAAPDANTIYGPALPILRTVSTNPTRINIGAVRENESPFGMRGEISVSLEDVEFRNQFGDFYASERTVRGSLGRLLLAWLGEAVPQLEMLLYSGKQGQALDEMVVRRYDVINMEPPSGGTWTIEGMDPLARASRKKANFPRATDIRLAAAIDDATTTIAVIGAEADVSDQMGNEFLVRYIRFGSEIVRYTGYSGSAGNWTLSGVTRGALGTVADSHDADDTGQRCGHFQDVRYYEAAYHVLGQHTTLDIDMIDYAGWVFEGGRYLSTLRGTGTYIEPGPAENVLSELMRDGLFYIWWDERAQLVKMIAMRQPNEAPRELTERSNFASARITRKPNQRMTRVTIYYDRGDPTENLEQPANYATMRQRKSGDAELPEYADGTIRDNLHYSRLIRADYNSVLVGASLLQRYIKTPEYIELEIAEKDASVSIGDVVAVTSYEKIDTLGQPVREFWQVIEWEEIEPGFRYRIVGQSFVLFPRASFIMENDAPDFASATDAQKLNACYITENDGTMPDGSVGYVLQ